MTVPTRTQLQRIRQGDVITANPFLNSIIDQLNRSLDDFKPPRQTTQPLRPDEQADKNFVSGTVTIETDDTILVLAPDGLIDVAKPPTLRGATATRTVAGEHQIIIPPYSIGDRVFCFKDIDGPTGVIRSGIDIVWQDLNVDGRQWAEDDS